MTRALHISIQSQQKPTKSSATDFRFLFFFSSVLFYSLYCGRSWVWRESIFGGALFMLLMLMLFRNLVFSESIHFVFLANMCMHRKREIERERAHGDCNWNMYFKIQNFFFRCSQSFVEFIHPAFELYILVYFTARLKTFIFPTDWTTCYWVC